MRAEFLRRPGLPSSTPRGSVLLFFKINNDYEVSASEKVWRASYGRSGYLYDLFPSVDTSMAQNEHSKIKRMNKNR